TLGWSWQRVGVRAAHVLGLTIILRTHDFPLFLSAFVGPVPVLLRFVSRSAFGLSTRHGLSRTLMILTTAFFCSLTLSHVNFTSLSVSFATQPTVSEIILSTFDQKHTCSLQVIQSYWSTKSVSQGWDG